MTEAGRRERKKARTRRAIADTALRLFSERGFDEVSVKEIAEAADVSESGLFTHFPTKESLVFDLDDDRRLALVSAVRDRRPGASALEALHEWFTTRPPFNGGDLAQAEAFLTLVESTPALRDYSQRMWLRHEGALAEAIAESGPDAPGATVAARALARFVLDRAAQRPERGRPAFLEASFGLLTDGWDAYVRRNAGTGTPAPPLPPPPPPAPPKPPGLRERKKAQTRQSIHDTALRLFLERGYDEVGMREIAEAAGVSIATLFTYFPGGKVSLIFPESAADRQEDLLAALRQRGDRTVLEALHAFMTGRGPLEPDRSTEFTRVLEMILGSPELRAHARSLWLSAHDPLAAAITAEARLPADDLTARLLARYVLQIPDLVFADPDPRASVATVFALLARGWPACLTDG